MKKAIVIGATSGIGKALAEMLAADQYQVGITGRRAELLTALQAENPERFIAGAFDVTDTGNSLQQLDLLVQQLGGLDLLILSAGTGDLNDTLDFSIEKGTIDTNVTGFTAIADWAFNYFRQQQHGHLVAISSIAGLRGGRHAPAYNASKAYQINYMESLRQKAAKLRLSIHVTDIRPGFVDTEMAKGEGKFWVAPVEKAARQMLQGIRKQRKIVYVTKRWGWIAFLLQRIPNWLFDRM